MNEHSTGSKGKSELDRLIEEFYEALKNGEAPVIEERPARRKPEICPNCGCATVAEILYGFVDVSCPNLRNQLDERKVVLGG